MIIYTIFNYQETLRFYLFHQKYPCYEKLALFHNVIRCFNIFLNA